MEPGWSNMRPRWIKMGHDGRRSNTKEAGREKEEATQKKQEERRKKQHKRCKKREGRTNTKEARRKKEELYTKSLYTNSRSTAPGGHILYNLSELGFG